MVLWPNWIMLAYYPMQSLDKLQHALTLQHTLQNAPQHSFEKQEHAPSIPLIYPMMGTHECAHGNMYLHIYVYMEIFTYVHIYKYVYIYINVYIYKYVHIHL